MDKKALKELQVAVLRSVRRRKERGAPVEVVLRFLKGCLDIFHDPRMRIFILAVMAVEVGDAVQSNNKSEVTV